jgi:hypothetical protein
MGDTHDEIERQKDEDAERVANADNEEVAIAHAFGFKKVTRAEERLISRFLAMLEGETGKTGKEALIAHCESLI